MKKITFSENFAFANPQTPTSFWAITKYALCLMAICTSSCLLAQPTFTGNVTFGSQADVTAWNPAFTEIDGNLDISGADITDLTQLSTLINITGDLTIELNPMLVNIDGFSSLSDIIGSIRIQDNALLMNIDGLSGIVNGITGGLSIARNAALLNLDGLANFTGGATSIFIGDNPALVSINLLSNGGTGNLDILDNNVLVSINFPTTSFILDNISIERNPALTSVNFPVLDNLTNIAISENTILPNIDFPMLSGMSGSIQITENPMLTSIDGFNSLSGMGGYIYINGNNALVSLNGFMSLSNTESLEISDNAVLASINGFTSLINIYGAQTSTFGGRLSIRDNPMLGSINGFTILNFVGGNLEIVSNPMLISIDGLAMLATVLGNVEIWFNDILSNIDGLMNLSFLQGDLEILANPMLSNIDGLASLTTIEGNLLIQSNDMLANIDGLASLTSIVGDLGILLNPMLNACCGIFDLLEDVANGSIGGTISISNNLNGCNSQAQVLAICVCPALPTAPTVLSVSDSSCEADCVTQNAGSWTFSNTCPMGSSPQTFSDATSTTGGVALTAAPSYDQTSPQTLHVRCVCDSENSAVSPVQTISSTPSTCDPSACCPALPTAPTVLSLNDSSCEADCVTQNAGSWTFSNTCPMGSSPQTFSDATSTTGGVALTAAPSYDQVNSQTLHVRCVCDSENSAVSPVQTISSTPSTCDPSACAINLVPTMSEWGLFLFGLLMINLGLVFMYNQQREYV